MARTLVNGQTPTPAGAVATYAAATPTDGNKFYNSGRTLLRILNGSGAPITATFQTPGSTIAGAIPDLTATIAAGVEKLFGQFPIGLFNQADGTVWVDFSSATSVTLAVIEP